MFINCKLCRNTDVTLLYTYFLSNINNYIVYEALCVHEYLPFQYGGRVVVVLRSGAASGELRMREPNVWFCVKSN